MPTITVEVSEDISKKFKGKTVIQYEDILDYEEGLKYSFTDEKVRLEELSDLKFRDFVFYLFSLH